MLTTPHLLVGAAIGAQFQNPLLIASTAAASHFVIDSVPHLMGIVEVEELDKKGLAFVAMDVLFGIAVLWFLTVNNPNSQYLLLGAFCSFLPDFHHTFQAFFGPDKLKKYTHWHRKFHYKKPIRLLPGIATQVATVLLSVLIILNHNF